MRDSILQLLKVPPEPSPPPGAPPTVFRAADNYFMILVLRAVVGQFFLMLIPVGVTVFLVVGGGSRLPDGLSALASSIVAVVWLFYVAQLIFHLAIIRLDFELRWYMLSDRAIRVREGIVTIREKTIALANIQNLEVRQGPLQRILGISDLEVKTAGGGAESSRSGGNGAQMIDPLHIAYFRGVSNASAIRDLIRESIRKQRDTGLGDPDDRPEEQDLISAAATEMIEAARDLRRLFALAASR